jgi:cell division protein FtsB
MPRTPARSTAADTDTEPAEGVAPGTPATRPAAATASLADLPVAGLTRRRIALLIGAVIAAWVIVLFARQVGEASEATGRADAMRASNAQLATDVAAAQRELDLIQRQAYIDQQAREYRLGSPREIPFILADDAPPLGPDAPGSSAVRLGAVAGHRSPLESWLDLLFGSGDDAGTAQPATTSAPPPEAGPGG